MKRKVKSILALWVAVGFVVACGAPATPTSPAATVATTESAVPTATPVPTPVPEEVVLTIGQSADCTQFDPQNSSAYQDFNVYDNIYETLLRRDAETMELKPLLALSWEPVDELTWQFELREGVEFTNGEPFNAETVKYTLERVMNPDNELVLRSQFASIDRVEVVDEYTANIVTIAPDPLLPARMAGYGSPMVPPEHTERVGSGGLTLEPIGTGPYKFVEWVKDDQVVLEANDEYWGGRPTIDKVIFKPIPELAARVAALQVGEIDIAPHLPPDAVAGIVESGKARTESTTAFVVVVFGVDVQTPPLDNKLIRQAISYAIDRDSVCSDLWLGQCTRLYGGIGPLDFAYDPDQRGLAYDPDKARQLIEEAGYAGETIKIVTPSGLFEKDLELTEAVQGWLQAVGLNTEIEVLETSVYYEVNRHERPLEGIQLMHTSNPLFDPDGTWWRLLQQGGYLDNGWRNPEFDSEMLRARSILDSAERETIYHEMVYGLMAEEMPVIPVVSPNLITGLGPRVASAPARADSKIYVTEIVME